MNIQNLLTQYTTLLQTNISQDTPVHWVFDSAFNYLASYWLSRAIFSCLSALKTALERME
jgi:hypothetical protein